MQGIHEAREE